MAYSSRGIGGREFWLPSDIPMDKYHYTQQHPPLNTDLCFPTDFPYEFGSPVESLVGSTESESDDDDLIACLTRHLARSTIQVHKNISVAKQNLEKSWVLSGSPQSTLSAVGTWSSNGSPNGPSQAPSPPTTPYGVNEDSWDLIYAAAGQVAMLNKSGDWVPNCWGPTVPPRNLTPAYPSPVVKPQNTGVYLNQCLPHTLSQPNHSSVWGREAKEVWPSQQQIYRQNRGSLVGLGGDSFGENGKSERALRLSQSAWPPLKVEQQHRPNPPQQHGGSGIRGVFAGGSDSGGVKRECAGTGVFLPRRYDNLTESRKKPGTCSFGPLYFLFFLVTNRKRATEQQKNKQQHQQGSSKTRILWALPPLLNQSFCGLSTHQNQSKAAMAATRIISSSSSTNILTSSSSSSFFNTTHFPKSHTLHLCFTNRSGSLSKKRLFTCRALYKPQQVQTKEAGQPQSLDYRVYFLDNAGKKVSPWHDIPLHLGDGVFNFIVEIPKESSAKMEVATDEPFTPIKQDTKKGKLRYYPYNINWNYGLLPQTWEDPSLANPEVEGAFGDNDPVDVVEIGESHGKIGEILKVKPLGALAMIDEGELDWKIVAISLDDPRASLVNDVNDVEQHFPGTLTAIRDWFRDYKIPDGKPANKFGLGNKAANKEYALKVITETNEAWAKLVKRSVPSGELSLV